MTDYLAAEDSQHLVKDALADELNVLCQGINALLASDTVSEQQLQLLRGLISVSHFATQQAAQEQYSAGELLANLDLLQQEVETLRVATAVYERQIQWFKEQEALFRTTIGHLRIKAILKQMLQVGTEITYAATGSIFLLGEGCVIIDCILMREQTTDDQRRDLIGRALEKGLAGWVAQNLTIGWVNDTRTDNRWMNFSDQPYQVGSALCIPMMVEQRLVGILTLTHPDTHHFTQQDCDVLMAMGAQTALLFENDRLNGATKRLTEQVKQYDGQFRQLLQTPLVGVFVIHNNKFIHINAKLAALLGYGRDELLKLPSIASVIAYEDRPDVSAAIKACLAGKVPQMNLTFCITRKNGQVTKVMAQGLVTQFNGRSVVMGMMDAV